MRQSIINIHLAYLYRREIIGFWLIGIILIVSSYLLISSYFKNRLLQNNYQTLILEKTNWQKIEKILNSQPYQKFFTSRFKIRESEIYQELSVIPFSEFLEKFQKLYVENGYLFVEEVTYKSKQKEKDVPSIIIKGKKIFIR